VSGRGVAGWLLAAALLAAGGAAYIVAAQWLAQLAAELFVERGRLVPDAGAAMVGLGAGTVAVSAAALVILGLAGQRGGRRWGIVLLWLLAYVLLGLLALALNGISLPVFATYLLAFGLLAGWLVASPRRPPAPAGRRAQATRRRGAPTIQASAVVDSRQFGRVPAETVLLLTQHVRHARGPILAAVPAAPQSVKDFTVAAVLDRTLEDWWRNGNTHGLTDQDIDDLKSFVALAAALAASAGVTALSLQAPEGQAVYRATLRASLDDWLANWNAGGRDGPPVRP
jgi:hypothetical protein